MDGGQEMPSFPLLTFGSSLTLELFLFEDQLDYTQCFHTCAFPLMCLRLNAEFVIPSHWTVICLVQGKMRYLLLGHGPFSVWMIVSFESHTDRKRKPVTLICTSVVPKSRVWTKGKGGLRGHSESDHRGCL